MSAPSTGSRPRVGWCSVTRTGTRTVPAATSPASRTRPGTVRVPVLVTEHHPTLGLEPVEGALIGDVPAVLVLQWNGDPLPGREGAGPRGARVLHREHLVAADEGPVVVLDHRAGEQVALAQDL